MNNSTGLRADDGASLGTEIHDTSEDAFGYVMAVMVRRREELGAVVDAQPFEDAVDTIKRYMAFLDGMPTDEEFDGLHEVVVPDERIVVVGSEVSTALDTTELSGSPFPDVGTILGMAATRRIWKVVTSVLQLTS